MCERAKGNSLGTSGVELGEKPRGQRHAVCGPESFEGSLGYGLERGSVRGLRSWGDVAGPGPVSLLPLLRGVRTRAAAMFAHDLSVGTIGHSLLLAGLGLRVPWSWGGGVRVKGGDWTQSQLWGDFVSHSPEMQCQGVEPEGRVFLTAGNMMNLSKLHEIR